MLIAHSRLQEQPVFDNKQFVTFIVKRYIKNLTAKLEPEKAEELPPLRRDASLAVTEAAEPELLDVVLLVTSELNEFDGPGQDSCNL